MNPTKWAWDGDTWAGIGLGAVAGGAAGLGFYYAAPALAGTGFFSGFGASGTVAAYTITGAVAGGATGYGAGFGGGMLYSNGDWGYSHQSGVLGAKVGATIGSVVGAVGGVIQGYNPVQGFNNYIDSFNESEPEVYRATSTGGRSGYSYTPEEEAYISTVNVNLTSQRMTFEWSGVNQYDLYNSVLYPTGPFRISSGATNNTPTGNFVMGWKYHTGMNNSRGMKSQYPNSLPSAPEAHWAVNITGAFFFHSYPDVPNYPASHGCVRIADESIAGMLWKNVRLGVSLARIFGRWPGF